jgi:hypothetical protein
MQQQDTAQRHKRGGLYFEDFVPGTVYEHRLTRTRCVTRGVQRYAGPQAGGPLGVIQSGCCRLVMRRIQTRSI